MMIRFGNRRGQELQKPGLGFVGKMINIFDLSSGMRTTKLLTNKPHRDGSPPRRNRSDMVKKKPTDTYVVEDNSVPNEHRKSSSKKSSGTPMKVLIAQELLREMEYKQKPTNVVARLMGLDALPGPQPNPTPKRSFLEGYSHNFSSGEFQCHRQVEDDSCRRVSQFDPPSSNHEKECKDVHEVWQQPPRAGRFKDQPPRKGRIDENLTDKRMTLVRQKFSEAKRLATDERLLQTKEFQEALEVLSSNRDLFVKFLGEPSSLFAKNVCGFQSVLPSKTKRITVLKPSNRIEAKCEAQVIPLYPSAINIDQGTNTNQRNSKSSAFVHYKAENTSNPTRIVILKPSPGTPNEMNTTVASLINPPKQAEGRDFNGSSGTEEDIVSREVKEITQQMQQYLSRQQRDEPLLSSSALSNRYVGDRSSFNRSENDFTEEGCCNASDSEAVTPTSRHSWDYNNRYGSPYSNSSFGHTSCSPEPSVIKEAKKRLSERWAMVASNSIYQEQNQMQRSSSTLGEILSIPKAKNEDGSDGLNVSSRRSCGGEQEPKSLIGCFSTGGMKVLGCGEDAPSNFTRSKSLPVSSSVYEKLDMNGVVPGTLTSKSIVPKEVVKSKNGASSLREKVSSFFSGSKKSGRENHIHPLSVGSDDRLHSKRAETSCKRNDASSVSSHDGNSEASMPINSENYGGTLSMPNSLNDGEKHVSPSAKASRSSEKSGASEISRDNQDLQCPISVLETPFGDDANNVSQHSISAASGHPRALSRSPPIGSVSRTITRGDSPHLGRPLPSSSKLSKVLSKECEDEERFTFVQKLLSSASLVDIGETNILARWHSLDSPLDPMLLDEFLDRKGEEAKCRERRSNQRLLFDCVNAALLDTGWSALKGSYPHTRACGRAWRDGQKCSLVAEEVWRLVRDLFSSEEKQVAFENRNAMVEGLVKREVAGSGWAESMPSEVDEFSDEIGREVVDELVKETLADLTGVCFS